MAARVLYVHKSQEARLLVLISTYFVRTVVGMNKRMGRPPKSGDVALTARLEIRVEPDEKDAYDKAADAAKMERSDWIRATLNAAAKRAMAKSGKRSA